MKYLAICLTLLLLIYLNRTYSYFYYKIGLINLQPTLTSDNYLIGDYKTEGKVLNYVALGDSLTSGVGSLDYSQTFPFILAQKIDQKNKKQVKMSIISTPGAKTEDLISNQLNNSSIQTADYITLLIGINDIHDLRSVDNFQKNFDQILSQLSKLKAKIIILNIPYLGPNQSLSFPYQFLFDYQTRSYNSAIAELSLKYQIQLIDLYSNTKIYSQNPGFYASDSFHPSSEGYKFWGELINP